MSDGYWVYVGGLKSQADADHALVTLEHGGIKDALMMPETPDAGRRLSLGLYSERSRAERRAQSVRQTGLKAEVGERKIPGTLYWVDLAPLPGMSTIPIQDLFAEGVNSRISVQPCPAAAPPAPVTPATAPAAATRYRQRCARGARAGNGGQQPGSVARRDTQAALTGSGPVESHSSSMPA